ncbi:MAG: hypothetical protein JO101_04780 [Candidatus Eremiobacteraeota bacterium]|nr:hypothetical protein [Candidatus Eremiobacteraeota bacterium]MBV8354614.1 hypothetical protein [Candidatus Eremiobacteraeota bacterium]
MAAWAARWPLYLALAAASVALEFGLDVLLRFEPIALQLILATVDAFVMTLASLDAASRAGGDPPPLRDLLRATLKRWWLVAIVAILLILPAALAQTAVFGNADETLYGLAILPGIFALGMLGLPTVIAAVEIAIPPLALPGYALLRTLIIAWPLGTLLRLIAGGAIVAVPLMLQYVLNDWLGKASLGGGPAWFWANVPVDALQLAPVQLFFTYLYLDIAAREARAGSRA